MLVLLIGGTLFLDSGAGGRGAGAVPVHGGAPGQRPRQPAVHPHVVAMRGMVG